MRRSLLAALILLLILPAAAFASRAPASFSAARSLLVASSSPGNAYAGGVSVVTTAPVQGDLTAVAGSIVVASPVRGDVSLLAGSLSSRARVGGDLKVLGGSIAVLEPVGGDLVALGVSVRDSGSADGSVFVAAVDVALTDGAAGPVTVYGNDILLGGDFAGPVRVVASGRVTLSASTTVRGTLSYEAPEPAVIPESATLAGGVEYTSASYLPGAGTSRILALVSIGFFLFVRILGALILAGLLTGLFPRLAEAVVERAYAARPRSILLSMLLGFAILAATPILLMLLSFTFVGMGLALLLFVLYVLMTVLAVMYAGILLGGLFAHRFAHRSAMLWHDGVLGMLAFSLITLVPAVGSFAVLLLTVFSIGVLLQLFFNFAFPREEHTSKVL